MLLWLPVFTGNAFAASITMLMPQSCCPDATAAASMSHGTMNMDMGGHDMHHGEMSSAQDNHDTCGVCHLACSGFIAMPVVAVHLVAADTQTITFLPEIFVSHHSAPLDPPPLALI